MARHTDTTKLYYAVFRADGQIKCIMKLDRDEWGIR